MALKQGGYVFREDGTGAEVFHRGRSIGRIVTMYERGGRHCFRLGFDNRKQPRTYRGRIRAAAALKLIDTLLRQAKKQRWTRQQLIIEAWDSKPQSAPSSNA